MLILFVPPKYFLVIKLYLKNSKNATIIINIF
uniref:Uncharacterized protein n=1 Tax=Siphoviridae sp. ctl0E3 TaxID=2827586 RepID=A0A8S5LP87_9CAUD|nr:MAG TPA: hypothetical protein [Siphoviridae sp. ctl0E3]